MFTLVKRTFSKFNPFAQAEAAAYFEKAMLKVEVDAAFQKARLADSVWNHAIKADVLSQVASCVPLELAEDSAIWHFAGSSFEKDSEGAYVLYYTL